MNPLAAGLRLIADLIDPAHSVAHMRADAYARGYADAEDLEARRKQQMVDAVGRIVYQGSDEPEQQIVHMSFTRQPISASPINAAARPASPASDHSGHPPRSATAAPISNAAIVRLRRRPDGGIGPEAA
jgi:hypothetical protein